MKIQVQREQDNGTQTIGQLFVIDEKGATVFKCFTLELPWKDNQRGISCIPAGTYICKKKEPTTAIPYKHISITNITGRSGVAIHRANFYKQLKGCIAVGATRADMNKDGQQDITSSGQTFDKLMAIVPDEFKLEIK